VSEPANLQLLPVTVTTDQPAAVQALAHINDLIEIELVGGYRVRIGNGVKAAALRLVLDVLERR
jgi:transposase